MIHQKLGEMMVNCDINYFDSPTCAILFVHIIFYVFMLNWKLQWIDLLVQIENMHFQNTLPNYATS